MISIQAILIKILKISFIITIYCAKVYAQSDGSNLTAYTLPEILKTIAGSDITNKASWEKIRRPEILSLFENNVYGQMPKDFDSIKFTVINDVANAMNGKAHLKEITVSIWRINKQVDIHLTLFIPSRRKKPVPAFLLINNRPVANTDAKRETKSEFWPAEMIIDSGYAIGAFNVNDAAPDDKDTYQNGVLELYPRQLIAENGMKAIGAWAWAASRIMDYFKTDKDIDFNKIAVVGHSRGGKAALWAGAEDQRFAIVIANCSGNTGAALSRRQFGETVKVINTNFPHWFAGNYKKFGDDVNALPVDQHMLIALIAPRPLYTTNASKDLWADPEGSYLSLINGQKAYALYGKKSALQPTPPAINSPVINSILGYHIREGVHDLTMYDWENFIKFANFHYKYK